MTQNILPSLLQSYLHYVNHQGPIFTFVCLSVSSTLQDTARQKNEDFDETCLFQVLVTQKSLEQTVSTSVFNSLSLNGHLHLRCSYKCKKNVSIVCLKPLRL